jgi:hypothetical protein
MRKHGSIDRKIDLDHLCRVRSCVNPDHLEPTNRKQNLNRGANSYDGVKVTCRKGLHDTTLPDAIYFNGTGRECKECWRIRYRAAGHRYRLRLKAH